jgi:hypothetical protein
MLKYQTGLQLLKAWIIMWTSKGLGKNTEENITISVTESSGY